MGRGELWDGQVKGFGKKHQNLELRPRAVFLAMNHRPGQSYKLRKEISI